MNKKVVVLGILAVCLSISIGIGFSYAVWTQTEKQSTTNLVQTGCFEISLTNEKNIIDLANQYPISDEKGKTQIPYTFTVTNTCSIYASYAVNLEKLSGSNMDNEYIKVMLSNKRPQLYSYYSIASKEEDNSLESRTLTTDGLNAGESKEYSLRIWLDENGTNETVGGKTFNSKIVIKSVATYQSGAEYIASLLESNQSTMKDDDPDENVRYIGVNPNNYVTFNNELWRIIGVFDMFECNDDATISNFQNQCSAKKLLKLIRNELLGIYYWDYDTDNTYKNNWAEATLNNALNNFYYNSTSGTSGKQSYDFTTNGLKEEAQDMIANTMWNLGGLIVTSNLTVTSYISERGSTVYSESPTKWIGKVGLMYLSDYGYATSGGTTYDRTFCLDKDLYSWDTANYKTYCAGNDWLWDNVTASWTLTPNSTDSIRAFSMGGSGMGNANNVNILHGVRPVVYLKSDIQIIHDKDHDGSENKPYELSI